MKLLSTLVGALCLPAALRSHLCSMQASSASLVKPTTASSFQASAHVVIIGFSSAVACN